MKLENLVKKTRKTRADICKEAGISRGLLSLLERGERSIGIDKVVDLAHALNVEPSVLRPDLAAIFGGQASPSSNRVQS